jgi:hypothetical protein
MDANYAALLSAQRSSVQSAFDNLVTKWYSAGEFIPSDYQGAGTVYGREQWPAAVAAILSRDESDPNKAAVEARVAIDTVNNLFARHLLANGDFDNGTAGTPGDDVADTYTAQGVGLAANVLQEAGRLDAGTLHAWEQDMFGVATWLWNKDGLYYVNGNVDLRMTVVFLEALKLAQADGDSSDASTLQSYYQQQQAFTMNPNSVSPWPPAPYLCTVNCESPQTSFGIGWNQDGAAGYFSEAASGGHNTDCANNPPGPETPCILLDWDYTGEQLYTAEIGYVLSGYDPWWQNIVIGEYNTLLPRLTNTSYWNAGGFLDTTSGSRHSAGPPPPPYFNPLYGVTDMHNLASRDDLWLGQLADYQRWQGWTVDNSASAYTPNMYDCGLIAYSSLAILDAENQ